MIVDSRSGRGDPAHDLSVYAGLRLADLRASPAGEFWGMFVERDHPLPRGLVLPLEVWVNPGAEEQPGP